MSKNTQEGLIVPLEALKESVQQQERPTNSMSEAFERVKEIIHGETYPSDLETEDTFIHLGGSPEQIASAKEEVGYDQRRAELLEKKNGIQGRFDEKIHKALLPIVAILTLGSGPLFLTNEVSAAEGERSRLGTGETMESRENVTPELFDPSSPLYVSSAQMERLLHKTSVEEASLVKDLAQKVWTEKNEWISYAGNTKDGLFLSSTQESGAIGGYITFGEEISNIEKDGTMRHTHPIEAIGALTPHITPEMLKSGEKRPFIMPPSLSDILTCMQSPRATEEVVDPRGVWHYHCDKKNHFTKEIKKAIERSINILQDVHTKYKVEQEELDEIDVSKTHPSSASGEMFSQLEEKHPGIQADFQETIARFAKKNLSLQKTMANYEFAGIELTVSSMNKTDVELANDLRNFITAAGGIGVTMSYTPFKEPYGTVTTESTSAPELPVSQGEVAPLQPTQ